MVGISRHRSACRFIALLAAAAMAASIVSLWVSVRGFAIATGPDITFQPGDNLEGTEPKTVPADSIVARFIDLDNVPVITAPSSPKVTIPLCGNPDVYTATIDWGDGTATDMGTVDCDSSEQSQYAVFSDNAHKYRDSGTYHISVTVDDRPTATSPADADTAQTATASITDAAITATSPTELGGGGEGFGMEGSTLGASAFFLDSNSSFADVGTVDPGLTATISWGDGSTSPASISFIDCSQCGNANVQVGGTHVYDANIPASKPYSVSITLKDDGGKSATSEPASTPAFADGKLTGGAAKTFTATATQSKTTTVASFTDAALDSQSAVGDFTASINWGDNTTSSGTITKTGPGAFDVSGTHTYASAGSKSLTVTVTDEEGSTATMHATATVAAAPVVLPATGQPDESGSSGWPWLAAALMLLGLAAIATGLVRGRLVKGR